jgi:hypothetical protein
MTDGQHKCGQSTSERRQRGFLKTEKTAARTVAWQVVEERETNVQSTGLGRFRARPQYRIVGKLLGFDRAKNLGLRVSC